MEEGHGVLLDGKRLGLALSKRIDMHWLQALMWLCVHNAI